MPFHSISIETFATELEFVVEYEIDPPEPGDAHCPPADGCISIVRCWRPDEPCDDDHDILCCLSDAEVQRLTEALIDSLERGDVWAWQ